MDSVRLRRPILARLFGTTFQGLLTFVATIFILTFAALTTAGDWSQWPWLIGPAVATLCWLRRLTGWAVVDDAGLHWRTWLRWDHPWDKVRKVTLTRHAVWGNSTASGPPIILVWDKGGGEDFMAPARGCGRRRRDFATEVLAAARAHGVRTEVLSRGWNEEPTRIAEPWA